MGAKICRVLTLDPCNEFTTDLVSVIMDKEPLENVVYSPASIHVGLTLVYGGAEGQTAEELRKVLYLSRDAKKEVLQKYKKFLKKSFESFNSSDDAPQLKTAIRLYVNKGLKVTSKFNKIARDYCDTETKCMDFRKNQEVVENINHWVEQQTENKIKNLLQTDAVNADTTAVLVNAIYFKAKWLRPFSKEYTMKAPFYMDNNQQAEVEMMYTKDSFGYGELPRLNATALAMPYKDSNISMLIILPNDRDGFKTLGKELITLDFYGVSAMLRAQEVSVFLPKFCIEYNIDLKETLKKASQTFTLINIKFNFFIFFRCT